jgi:hypothetical protein
MAVMTFPPVWFAHSNAEAGRRGIIRAAARMRNSGHKPQNEIVAKSNPKSARQNSVLDARGHHIYT